MRKVDVEKFDVEGVYHHFNLQSELTRNLSLFPAFENDVQLQFNIDGLPIYNSSKLDFWPILCRATSGSLSTKVFMAGLYCGKSKPHNVHQFLSRFVQDLLQLLSQGIVIREHSLNVKLHSFICDAPARQYVKRIKGHSGFDSCERCLVHGEEKQRFVSIDWELRTDEHFRARKYAETHQNKADNSPLFPLPIDLIHQFPLDYMHLFLLGVVKRLLHLWLGHSNQKLTQYSAFHRLSASQTQKDLRLRVEFCSNNICSEFDRRPRQFDECKYFKAKEYRTLLCYTFPFIFKGLFQTRQVYDHFLLLVVSFRIILGLDPTPDLVDYVRNLLRIFVRETETFYGRGNMTYSVHNLIHIPDDYQRFGVLDKTSSFPFESYMYKLKHYVTRPGKEVQQVVKRVYEENLLELCPVNVKDDSVLLRKEHKEGPIHDFDAENVLQFKEVLYKGRKFSVERRDCFVMCNERIGKIVNFVREEEKLFTLVQFCASKGNFFTYPCFSSEVGIFKCGALEHDIEIISLNSVSKCMSFPVDDGFYVAKLLHETM